MMDFADTHATILIAALSFFAFHAGWIAVALGLRAVSWGRP